MHLMHRRITIMSRIDHGNTEEAGEKNEGDKTNLGNTTKSDITKELTSTYKQDRFVFQSVSFQDKLILNILINGIVDTTFDLPLSTQASINRMLKDEESLGIEPVVLVGDPSNLKLQVIAGQISKVILLLKDPKNTILSLGSKWFGRGHETGPHDFEKLVFVLENVKALLLM